MKYIYNKKGLNIINWRNWLPIW